jgi:predicted MFS family arabinose efflux permease
MAAGEGHGLFDREGLKLLSAIILGGGVGVVGMDAAPLLLGAYADVRGLGEDAASLIASAELGGAALVSIAFSGRAARGSRSRLAYIGAAIVGLAQLVSMQAHDFGPLLASRALAGSGAGLLLACTSAAAAGARDPERVFGIMAFSGGFLGAVFLGLIGVLIGRFGLNPVFGVIAALALLSFGVLRWLPDGAPAAAADDGRLPNLPRAAAVLGAISLISLGQGAVWSFNERMGLAVGLTVEQTGAVLAGTGLFGLVGAAASAWLGTRRGRTVPLLLGVAGSIISTLLLVSAKTIPMFILADTTWAICIFFALPYLMGTLASLDRRGRWAATGSGVGAIGGALGPASGGLLVEAGSYSALGGLVLACGSAALLLLAPVLISLDRQVAAERA